MRSTHRVRLGSVILACLLFSSALAQDESRKERAATAADEAALRALAQEVYAGQAKRDLESFMKLWSAKAPGLAARRQAMQKFYADYEIEVKGLVILKMAVESATAKLRVEREMNVIEVKTGKPAVGSGKMTRTLESVKEEGAWKVWRETLAEEDLATALFSVKSDVERSALLIADKELVTERLVQELNRQGVRFGSQGNYPEALARFRLALNIAEQIGDKVGMTSMLNNIGIVHSRQGNYVQALEHYQKGLEIIQAMGNKAHTEFPLHNIGNIHLYQGNHAQALEYFKKSLAVSEDVGNKEGIASTLNSIGNVYILQGNYAQALEYLQKGLTIREALGEKAEISTSLKSIGIVHLKQGNYAQALEHYQKSLAMFEALRDKPGIASLLNSIGAVYFKQSSYTQALEHFQKSLAICESLGNKAGVGYALANIGKIHLNQSNYVQALEHFQKSLEVQRALGDKGGMSSTLASIGDVYYDQGNYAQALEYFQKGLAMSEAGDKAEVSGMLTRVGETYRALDQLTPARKAFEEAIATIETLRAQIAGGEQEQQRFFEKGLDPYRAMVELLVAENQSGAALAYAERAKARVLLDVLHSGRTNVTKAMTATEGERERGFNNQLVSLNTQISREHQRSQPDPARVNDLKTQLQKVRLDYEAFQTSLYAAHPELKSQRGEVETLTPEQARALLPDARSALLEYVVTDERTYLFALTANAAGTTTELKVYPLEIKRKELDDRAARFRETLAKGSPGFRQPARELYDLLLKPAAAQLQGRTSLVIVPDGVLWELPFQALQPAATRYLIEDCAIAYAPSLTALREMIKLRDRKKVAAGSSTLLAFGNPALGKQTIARAKSVLMDEKLDPLPEAERQVNVMRQIYGAANSKVYIGAEAREERAKAEAASYRILHLATHGILNNSSPMYSHLVLAQAEGDPNEDGLLEAWEIMKMDLKADLTVLSACETARGRVGAGEGMIGLSWALFVAGCPTSVVSQWKVESASTTELMLEFHRRLKSQMANPADGLSAARALREAALKLQRSNQYRHPFYWAGFVVAGKGF